MLSANGRFNHFERQDLIDHILWLEGEAGLSRRATDQAHLASEYGLGPKPIRLILALRAARGRVLSMQQLMEAAGSEAETTKTITVMICQIRERCGRDVIQTHPGFGYSITQSGVELIETTGAQRKALA